MHSIGELARATGVKVPTIRYYEQMGLIEAAGRSEGNQRRYDRAGLERLAFIRHARELGLSIGAIRELIELSLHPQEPCEGANRIARQQLDAVRSRIARLRRLEGELERIATGCESGNIADCYVIRALCDHDMCAHEH